MSTYSTSFIIVSRTIYNDETGGISGHIDVSSCDEGRYKDATSTIYVDVTGNLEGSYTNVPCCEEGRYTDETSEISRHANVSSYEEGRYIIISTIFTQQVILYYHIYNDETGGISGHVDVSSCDEGR